MRLFINQQNLIVTDPVIDEITGEPLTTLTLTFKYLNGVTTLATATLVHTTGGIYSALLPVVANLEDKKRYQAELTVSTGPTIVWYFKGPCRAIIRSHFDDEEE
jgi:hypothetical protein